MEKKLSDPELMLLISSKDEKAFVEIFQRYASKVKGLMIKLGAKLQDAEEITQEVIQKILDDVEFNKEVKIPKKVCIGVCAGTTEEHFNQHCVNKVKLKGEDEDAEIEQ